jgi:translation initiation factor 2B subunit (eIF-2B alpha/beta/delta family)
VPAICWDNSRVSSLAERVRRIANDRTSGASAVFEAALAVLEQALDHQAEVLPLARTLVGAHPTMAPIWAVSIEALAARAEPERFPRFARRARRAPAALTRVAVDALASNGDAPLHAVTLSYSGAVARALVALRARGPLRVSCAEGRPGLEGRRLAGDLVTAGIPVTLYSDAAIGVALETATCVVVGADAVAPELFFNKVGTQPLAAAATLRGVPVYVLATRDKFVDQSVLERIRVHEATADEIWPEPPAGVEVRNPYFEPTPLDLVGAVVTDAGVIGTADVPGVCASTLDLPARQALAVLCANP